MKLYQCVAHGLVAPSPADACMTCFEDQERARASNDTADRRRLRFSLAGEAEDHDAMVDMMGAARLYWHAKELGLRGVAHALYVWERLGTPVEVTATKEEKREAPRKEKREEPKGPRVAGVDPGERWIAVTIAAGTVAPLTYVDSLVVEIERRKGEQPTDDDLDVAVGKVVDFCELHKAERVAVERAVKVHRRPDASPKAAAGGAAYLLRAQYVAGMIRGALRAATRTDGDALVPGKIESTSSVKGRNHVRKLAGNAPAAGSPWAPAARQAFGGTIPDGVGEHVLDAAVMAVWCVRPEEKPKAEPRPKVKRVRDSKSSNAARTAAAQRAKEDAGCTCTGRGRPSRSCPAWDTFHAPRAKKAAETPAPSDVTVAAAEGKRLPPGTVRVPA